MSIKYKAYLMLSTAVLFWSGNLIVARGLNESISAVALASGRWWLATLILMPFTWRAMKRDWPVIRQNWLIITLLGLTGVSLFNTLLYQAAHTTTSTNIALIQTTMPAMIVLIMALFMAEKHSWRAWLGVIVSVAGATLVVSRGDWQVLQSMSFVSGDLWMLLANLVYGIYSILLKKKPAISSLSLLGSSFIAGSLLLVPVFAWDIGINPLPQMTSHLAGSLLYVAIFPSIASYLAWNRGVSLIGPSLAGFFICLMPVFTGILATVFLQEGFYWYHVTGLLFIFAGFVLFQQKK